MKLSVLTPTIREQFLHITERALEGQTFSDFEWIVEIGNTSAGFTLPSDYNSMLRRSSGEIIVSLQDCISIPSDALESISQLGHERIAYTYPVAKDGVWDWRKYRNDLSITPNMWETDLSSAPRSLYFDIGGYDEEFNKGFSWDNVEVAWRAEAAGYRFRLSQAIEGTAIDHDKVINHPYRNKRENNDKRANDTANRARRGDYKLSYL